MLMRTAIVDETPFLAVFSFVRRSSLFLLMALFFGLLLPGAFALTNLNACANLTTAGETYVVNESFDAFLNASEVCFDIQADNIVLDGTGMIVNNSVVSGDGQLGTGVQITGQNNVTVKNFLQLGIFARAIKVQNGQHYIENNTLLGRGMPLEFDEINHSVVNNNNLTSVDLGNSGGASGATLDLDYAFFNNFSNNIITQGHTSSQIVVKFLGASHNRFWHNRLIIANQGASSGWLDANLVQFVPMSNNTFTNGTFESFEGTMQFLEEFLFDANSNFGTSYTMRTQQVNVSLNSAFVNTTFSPFLNTTAQITLYNITSTDPQPLIDIENSGTFAVCGDCDEISFSNNIYVFNVSHFTTYSSNETPAQDIDGDGIDDASDPIVGTPSQILSSGFTSTINVTVNGGGVNGAHSGEKEVLIVDGNDIIINFTHNFSATSINLSRMNITLSPGGIVVNLTSQLSFNKSLYVTDTGFTSLCVVDRELASITEITASCTGVNEFDFTSCLGNAGPTTISGRDCYDMGSTIRVENLTHSGIRGTGGASISGATILNEGASASFTESTAGSDNSQGANVTEINFSTTASTTKWQGYFGNVEGNLRMGSGNSILYNFGTLPVAQIAAVFASTDSNFDFSATTAATAGNVDTIWGFTTADADSGTNVFADGSATISDVTSVPVANLTAYTSAGVLSTGIYQSGVVTDGGTVSAGAYEVLAFGVNVDADERDFSNSTVIDFELIVPVNGSGSAAVQSYFFFMDIN